jgi:hypothetical protein
MRKTISLLFSLTLVALMMTSVWANDRVVSLYEKGTVVQRNVYDTPRTLDECTEIIYDDGTFENAWAWYYAGSGFGVLFTVEEGYPATVDSVRLQIYEGWPDSDREPIGIKIFDIDQNEIFSSEITMPGTNAWYTFPTGPTVVDDDFYIFNWQLTDYTDCEGVSIDDDSPESGRNWQNYEGEWSRWLEGDWAIRALVNCGPPPNYRVQANPYQDIVVKGGTYGVNIKMENNTMNPATGWLYAEGYGRTIGIKQGTIPAETKVSYNWNFDTGTYRLKPGNYTGTIAIGPQIGNPVDEDEVSFTVIKDGLE